MSKGPRPPVIPEPRPRVPEPRPGPGGSEAHPCEGPHEAAFTPLPSAAVGLSVVVVPSRGELTLVAGTRLVGRLNRGSAFERIAACIRDGWAFGGTVTEIDGATGEAVFGGEPVR